MLQCSVGHLGHPALKINPGLDYMRSKSIKLTMWMQNLPSLWPCPLIWIASLCASTPIYQSIGMHKVSVTFAKPHPLINCWYTSHTLVFREPHPLRVFININYGALKYRFYSRRYVNNHTHLQGMSQV